MISDVGSRFGIEGKGISDGLLRSYRVIVLNRFIYGCGK